MFAHNFMALRGLSSNLSDFPVHWELMLKAVLTVEKKKSNASVTSICAWQAGSSGVD